MIEKEILGKIEDMRKDVIAILSSTGKKDRLDGSLHTLNAAEKHLKEGRLNGFKSWLKFELEDIEKVQGPFASLNEREFF